MPDGGQGGAKWSWGRCEAGGGSDRNRGQIVGKAGARWERARWSRARSLSTTPSPYVVSHPLSGTPSPCLVPEPPYLIPYTPYLVILPRTALRIGPLMIHPVRTRSRPERKWPGTREQEVSHPSVKDQAPETREGSWN